MSAYEYAKSRTLSSTIQKKNTIWKKSGSIAFHGMEIKTQRHQTGKKEFRVPFCQTFSFGVPRDVLWRSWVYCCCCWCSCRSLWRTIFFRPQRHRMSRAGSEAGVRSTRKNRTLSGIFCLCALYSCVQYMVPIQYEIRLFWLDLISMPPAVAIELHLCIPRK